MKIFYTFLLFSFFSQLFAQNQQWDTQFISGNATDGKINSMTSSGNVIYAGGEFTNAGGTLVNNIARWNGISWLPLGTGTDGRINTVIAWNNVIYIGGLFTSVNGIPANNIAQWNGTNWAAIGSGTDGEVFSLVKEGDFILYAGGNFANAGGVPAANIARWDGSNWTALSSGTNNIVYALEYVNSNIIAGGAFTQAGGSSADYLANWNGTAWSEFSGGTNDTVFSILAFYDSLYIGGIFDQADMTAVNHIAMFNGTWNSLGTGTNDVVFDISVVNNKVCATGEFTLAGGISANYIAVWENNVWNSLGDGLNNYGKSVLFLNNDLFAGGNFTSAGLNPSFYFARWGGLPEIIDLSADINTCLNDSIQLFVDVFNTDTVYYQWQLNGTDITGEDQPELIIDPVDISDEGFYTCQISSSFGSIISDTVEVNIITPPDFTTQPIGGDFCVGEPLNMTIIASGENVFLQWQDNGSDISGANNSFYFIPGLNVSNSGLYTCIAENLCGSDTSSAAIVNVYPNPVVSFTGLDSVYCNSDIQDTLTGTPAGGVFSGSGMTGNVFNPLSLLGFHTISYALTDSNNCVGVHNELINIQQGASLMISGLETEYCFNSPSDTLIPIPAGGILTGTGITDSIFNPQAVPYGMVTINYSTIDTSGCQLGLNVSTFINSPVSSVITGLEPNYCHGVAADTFSITPAGGVLAGAITDYFFYPDSMAAGTYDFYYTFTDSNSCVNTDTFSLIIVNNLNISLGPDISICMGEIISAPTGFNTYLWSTSDTTIDISIIQSGNYGITVTDVYGCSGTDILNVTILSTPDVELGNDISISTDQTVIIGAGGNYNSYLWSTGATTAMIVVDGAVLGTGSHLIWVTAEESSGCTDSDSLTVHVGFGILVPENQNLSEIKIYPVPAEEILYINLPDLILPVNYEITDISGKVIINGLSDINDFSIDTENLSGGAYTISFTNKNQSFHKKLIIK
jgi:hypothetical protein